MLMPCLLF
jgi:RNA 3'-terminal phosphate cyclase